MREIEGAAFEKSATFIHRVKRWAFIPSLSRVFALSPLIDRSFPSPPLPLSIFLSLSRFDLFLFPFMMPVSQRAVVLIFRRRQREKKIDRQTDR
jgi:hypothetical protein